MKLKAFSEEQILNRIRFENPWWTTGKTDDEYNRMERRAYFQLFHSLVAEKRVKRAVVLMGPRRVGKTVMLFHAVQQLIDDGVDPRKIAYVSVETPIYTNIGLEQLFELVRKAVHADNAEGFYLIFDEVQYLRDWELHLKSLVDSYRGSKFVASGSAAAALKLKSIESGAGRFTEFLLPPLTFHEYLSMLGLETIIVPSLKGWNSSYRTFYDTTDIRVLNEHFLNYINYGGYPEAIFSDVIRSNPGRYIRHDIIDKVLLRDLPSLYGIQDVQELNALFTTIAYNSGNEFSLESLFQSGGIEKNTLKKYLTYLEAAFLIKVVHRVDMNAKRFRRANFFKIYLTNPSLRSALFSPITTTDEEAEAMVETAIFSQWFHRSDADLVYYARWKGGEVDMIRVNARQKPTWAVEVKWSNRYVEKPRQLKSLLSFLHENAMQHALVTTIYKHETVQCDDIALHFVPAALYAYTIGKNSIEDRRNSDSV